MLNLMTLGQALAVATLTAAVVMLLCRLPWRSPDPTRSSLGWALGVGAGFFLGCWVLELRPHWPPREDLDRFLTLALPAVVLVEVIGAFRPVPEWLLWALRAGVAGGLGRALLHGSSYLTDLTGPGSAEWSPAQAWMILGGLGAALAGVWGLLALLARRSTGPALPLALAVVCAAASLTVMLSGISTNGQMGLPLAGALAGAALLSPAPARLARPSSTLGVGMVGLAALLIAGRFFGELTTRNALLLLAAPLLCWVPELPYLKKGRPWLRGGVAVVLVALATVTVVRQAHTTFVEESGPGPSSREPSVSDYESLGR